MGIRSKFDYLHNAFIYFKLITVRIIFTIVKLSFLILPCS